MVSTVGSISIDLSTNARAFAAGFRNAATTVTRESGRMVAATKGVENSFRSLQFAAQAVGTALSANAVKNYADTWTAAGNKIRASGEIANVQVRSLEALNEIANRSRSGIEQTVELYARLVRSSSGVAKSEGEIAQVTETVAKAFKAYGSAASEQAAGILQLGQALGSGFLQGDELRSIRENAPLLAQAIAEEFGTTIGGLKQLGAEGQITSERVFKALIKARKDVEAAFAQTKPTIEDSFTQLKNNLTQAVGGFDQATGASHKFAEEIGKLGTAIETMGKDSSFRNFLKLIQFDVQKGGRGDKIISYFENLDIAAQQQEASFVRTVARYKAKVAELDAAVGEYYKLRQTLNETPPSMVGFSTLPAQAEEARQHMIDLRLEVEHLSDEAAGIEVKVDTSKAKKAIDELRHTDLAALWAEADARAAAAAAKAPINQATGPAVTRYTNTDKEVVRAVEKGTEATNRVAARATDVYRGVQQFDTHSAGYFDRLGSQIDSGLRSVGSALSYRVPTDSSGNTPYATGAAATSAKFSGGASFGGNTSWGGRGMTFAGPSEADQAYYNSVFGGRKYRVGGAEDASSITSGATSTTSGAINMNIVVKPVMEGSRLSGQSTAEIKQAASAGANAALRAFYGR